MHQSTAPNRKCQVFTLTWGAETRLVQLRAQHGHAGQNDRRQRLRAQERRRLPPARAVRLAAAGAGGGGDVGGSGGGRLLGPAKFGGIETRGNDLDSNFEVNLFRVYLIMGGRVAFV